MSLTNLGRAIAAGAVLSGVLLFQAVPVDAATNPTVIAVHQNGAVDVSGGSVLGRIASVSLPAGNWLITATATVIGTTSMLNRLECQLVAGNEFYKSRTRPSGGGVASYQPIVLILAHHFAKAGTATLACYTDGWLGADLIRDVHVTAVQVGQLSPTVERRPAPARLRRITPRTRPFAPGRTTDTTSSRTFGFRRVRGSSRELRGARQYLSKATELIAPSPRRRRQPTSHLVHSKTWAANEMWLLRAC